MGVTEQALIRVVGVGGGGVNAVNRMIEANLRGAEFIAINTDAQALLMSDADVKLEIGREYTRGLGAGADPEVGKKAATDHSEEIRETLEGSDMVFVTAGEGGGTGTGGAPVVAQIARELGALTVGVVTRPFEFEGRRRAQQADRGIDELREEVDALIVIPNQRLLETTNTTLSVLEAFRAADQVLQSSVQGITEIITIPAIVNVDFADVKSTLKDAQTALMGIGAATGPERALDAVEMAISSPLLESSMEGADRVLLFFQGGLDITMDEVDRAAAMVKELADAEANIIVGFDSNETFGDEIRVTVVAAGFGGKTEKRPLARVESSGKTTPTRPLSTTTEPKPVAPTKASSAPTSTTASTGVNSATPTAATQSTNAPDSAQDIAQSVASRLAQHRTEKPVVPELKAPHLPSAAESPTPSEAPVPAQAAPEKAQTPTLSSLPKPQEEPLAVTSGIRPVSPDASTVPNYVDSSCDQAAPNLRLPQVFDDITGKDEIDIPDFLR